MRGFNVMELLGIYAVLAGFGLLVGASFLISAIAGMFVCGGLFVFVGTTLVYLAAARERAAQANGQHAGGGTVRSVA